MTYFVFKWKNKTHPMYMAKGETLQVKKAKIYKIYKRTTTRDILIQDIHNIRKYTNIHKQY